MKVTVFNTQYYEKEYFERLNLQNHELSFQDVPLTGATAVLAHGSGAVSVLVHDQVDEPVLKALAGLGIKILCLRAAGFDNVDLRAAARYGIAVTRVPAYSPEAVAEHAVALLLASCRHIHKSHQRVKANNFSLASLMGSNLYNKTVGVIGTGKIGSAFCNIMLGFGCRILAYDKVPTDSLITKGINYVGLEELLGQSDIISLHCPLNEDTRYMIGFDAVSRMKKGVLLINTARGAVVNTADVIDGLATGHIGYYATDVYEGEERLFFRDWSASHITDRQFLELASFHNVLITPHQAFFTEQAISQIIAVTLQNLTDFQNGVPLANQVCFEP